MRLQGIFYARFYFKTLAYESKGRRFESCRGHQKLKLTSCEVSFLFAYLFSEGRSGIVKLKVLPAPKVLTALTVPP